MPKIHLSIHYHVAIQKLYKISKFHYFRNFDNNFRFVKFSIGNNVNSTNQNLNPFQSFGNNSSITSAPISMTVPQKSQCAIGLYHKPKGSKGLWKEIELGIVSCNFVYMK